MEMTDQNFRDRFYFFEKKERQPGRERPDRKFSFFG
jgi:hypothetical protein